MSTAYLSRAACRRRWRETCLVSRVWWEQPWGHESFNNAPHVCCDPPKRSSYRADVLLAQAQSGCRIRLLGFTERDEAGAGLGANAAARAEDAAAGASTWPFTALLHTSGGNALAAALTMCERVDVYGVGLHSAGLDADMSYVHFTDDHVATCANKSSAHGRRLPPEYMRWLRDRVTHEVVIHTLHAFGILSWRQ